MKAITTGIFYGLKAAGIRSPKVTLDAMDMMRLAGGIVAGLLVKDYAVYKKWINEGYIKKIYGPLKGSKITPQQGVRRCGASFQLTCHTFQSLKFHQDC